MKRNWLPWSIGIAVLIAPLAASRFAASTWAPPDRSPADLSAAQARMGLFLANHNRPELGLELCQRAVAANPASAVAHFDLAIVYGFGGDTPAAIAQYTEAALCNPRWAEPWRRVGLIRRAQGALPEARDALELALAAGDDADTRIQLAAICEALGDNPAAAGHYRAVLATNDRQPAALNNLAWILGTNDDPTLRDGPQAVALAERLCAQSLDPSPGALDTLAAAYAEVGQFDRAVETATRAAAAAERQGDARLQQVMLERLERYRARMPYRQPAIRRPLPRNSHRPHFGRPSLARSTPKRKEKPLSPDSGRAVHHSWC